eukprot:g42858.t1
MGRVLWRMEESVGRIPRWNQHGQQGLVLWALQVHFMSSRAPRAVSLEQHVGCEPGAARERSPARGNQTRSSAQAASPGRRT